MTTTPTTIPERLNAALHERYRVLGEVGRGGMATVYSAQDLKHERSVAIKVLHPELGAVLGVDRFLSEIRVTANLQHPNILPLFDSGAADGLVFYVMPLVEGETLRARLEREQQLPIADVVRIARSVASALDYAHRHGVIHRDVKPENIMLVDGQALVADFGIARAVTSAAGNRITESGISVGTPQYMSPEQATAERQLDGRSDVYSLGAVAYEMLTGEPPFTGANAPVIMAKLMTEVVADLSLRRKSVPRELAAAVHRALEKVPADRFGTAAQFAEALAQPLATLDHATVDLANKTWSEAAARARRKMSVTPWVIGAGAALIVIAAVLAMHGRSFSPANRSAVVATIAIPGSPVSTNGQYGNIAISPDGRSLVFRQSDGLHVRRLTEQSVSLLPGTGGATMPTFSPDGKSIAFSQGGVIRKVDLTGGPATDIASFAASGGLTWADDENIYSTAGVASGGIWREPATGGAPVQITRVDSARGEIGHTWPQLLPGGRALLFTAMGPSGGSEDSRVVAERLDSHERRTLVEQAMFGRYLATGQLIYAKNDGTIFAVDFDPKSLAVTGRPEPVLSDVETALWGCSAFLTVSTNGTAIFLPKTSVSYSTLQIVNSSGRVTTESDMNSGASRRVAALGYWGDARLSADGRRIAATGRERGVADIWVLDATSWNADRFSFDPVEEEFPVWSPDGRTIAYTVANPGASRRLVLKGTESGATPRVIRVWPRHVHLTSWSPDGRYLAFYDYTPTNGNDVWVIAVASKDSQLISGGPKSEASPAFSPDGRWVAYQSNETGRAEIYIVPFPPTGAKWQASPDGGTLPRWDKSGRILYYLHDGRLMAQPVTTGREFSKEQPTPMFLTDALSYDVAPDGKHFLLVRPFGETTPTSLTIIANWFDDLADRRRGAARR
jgi:eukaryotic-like serine/threonine-protein kinase